MGDCNIHSSAQICIGAIIGKPFRRFLDGSQEEEPKTTIINRNAFIGYFATVGCGSTIGLGAIIDDYCTIESRVEIGNGSLLIYRAQICNDSLIGTNAL